MAQLEEMRLAYQERQDSMSLAELLQDLGGWWLEPAKQYLTWVSRIFALLPLSAHVQQDL